MAPAVKTSFVCSDDDIMVDMVIAASQKKRGEALPSFGRDLVPYFVPGANKLTEDSVNINTDVDALRRSGASILEIPEPATSSRGGRESNNKRNKKSSPNSRSHGTSSPPKSPLSNTLSSARVSLTAPPGHIAAREYSAPFSSFGEAWAGPTYVNSPPPSSLPVPSFLKNQLKGGFAPISPATVHNAILSSAQCASEELASYPTNTMVIEGNLKRLLQVV